MKVTVDGIEFVLFNMYMPCDKGYGNHDLFEYTDVLNEVNDMFNKTASQYVVLDGDFSAYLTRDTPQTRALHSFVNNEIFVYVLMPNVLIYHIHTAQRAMAASQQYTILW